MIFSNNLHKLISELDTTVFYSLKNEEKSISINDLLGGKISLSFSGRINCIHCGRTTRKSYGQGFCFPCFQTVPEADITVLKPELDQSHIGIARDLEWAKRHNLIDHYVYLANTGDLKVGITRHTQIPTRWIDQGASQAIRIAKVPYRQLSGLIELELKKVFADKTNWRKMLTTKFNSEIDLLEAKTQAQSLLMPNFSDYLFEDHIWEINYPVLHYPKKVSSLNLDKTPYFSDVLIGIKGQYLIFQSGTVFNVRKHNGYYVEIEKID
jgi:hypothetical protein